MRWNPSTGALEYSSATKNGSWYARNFGSAATFNSSAGNSRGIIDFYAPSSAIDFTNYKIDSVDISLYVSAFSTTRPSPNNSLILQVWLRTHSPSWRQKTWIQPTSSDSSLFSSAPAGLFLGTITITGTGWYTLSSTNATLIEDLKNICMPINLVSIGLMDQNENLASAQPSWTTACLFSGFNSSDTLRPKISINYSEIQSAATIENFSYPSKVKYSGTIPISYSIKDTESDSQTVTWEHQISYGADAGDYVQNSVQSSVTTSQSGLSKTYSLPTSGIFDTCGVLFTLQKWVYDAANINSGATFSTNWSIGPGGYVLANIPAGRLKSAKYKFSAQTTTNYGTMEVYKNGALIGSDAGNYNPVVYFDADGQDIDLKIKNPQLVSNMPLTSVRLDEVDSSNNPVLNSGAQVSIRCKTTDNDGSSDYFYVPYVFNVNNNLPTSTTITEANSSNEIFTTNPSGVFSWTASTSTAGMSGYYLKLGKNSSPSMGPGDTFLFAHQTRTYSVVVPSESKWYFSVAPLGKDGVIGDTSSYGFFYNLTENVAISSGVFLNGTQIYTTQTKWVSDQQNPKFEWTAPSGKVDNDYTYVLQCGTSGNATGRVFETKINYNLIPSGNGAQFGFTLKDYSNLTILEKNTELDQTGWYYLTASGIFQMPDGGLPQNTLASGVRYILSEEDSVPEKISLHSYFTMGYFNEEIGGEFEYSYPFGSQSTVFNETDIGTAVVSSGYLLAHNGPIDVKLEVTPSGGAARTYFSAANRKGFQYKNSDGLWEDLPTTVSGSYYFKVSAEPYMLLPTGIASARFKFILSGIEDATWRYTTPINLQNQESATWNFTNPEIDISGIQQTQYILSAPFTNKNQQYFARLRVWDGMQYGDWTPTFKFKVNKPPAAPTNLRIV